MILYIKSGVFSTVQKSLMKKLNKLTRIPECFVGSMLSAMLHFNLVTYALYNSNVFSYF